MKRILKGVAVGVLIFVCIMGLRGALKRWAPGVYAWAYGPAVTTVAAAPIPAVSSSSRGDTREPELLPDRHDRSEKTEGEKEPELYATGRIWNSKLSWVIMSDGTVRSLDDNTEPDKPRLERIRRHFMDFEGKRYYYKARKSEIALQGSGAKGAPVRPDTEVPGVAVPDITGPDRTAASRSPGRATGATVSEPAPSTEGSWVTDKYGISRLREAPSLKSAFGR